MKLEILKALPKQAPAADRPPLLFVHGAFAGAWVWERHFLPFFAAEGYPCHAVSLRGHGGSGGRERVHGFGLADYVQDVIVALDQVATGRRRPVLIGHSMGGYIVQKAMETERVAAAVLMCSTPPDGLGAIYAHMAVNKPRLLWELSVMQSMGAAFVSAGAIREAMFSDDPPPDDAARYFAEMQAESQWIGWDIQWAGRPDIPDAHRVPMLVMGVSGDAFVPPSAVAATARAYDADLVELDMGAHAIPLSRRWREAAEVMRDWMARTLP